MPTPLPAEGCWLSGGPWRGHGHAGAATVRAPALGQGLLQNQAVTSPSLQYWEFKGTQISQPRAFYPWQGDELSFLDSVSHESATPRRVLWYRH